MATSHLHRCGTCETTYADRCPTPTPITADCGAHATEAGRPRYETMATRVRCDRCGGTIPPDDREAARFYVRRARDGYLTQVGALCRAHARVPPRVARVEAPDAPR